QNHHKSCYHTRHQSCQSTASLRFPHCRSYQSVCLSRVFVRRLRSVPPSLNLRCDCDVCSRRMEDRLRSALMRWKYQSLTKCFNSWKVYRRESNEESVEEQRIRLAAQRTAGSTTAAATPLPLQSSVTTTVDATVSLPLVPAPPVPTTTAMSVEAPLKGRGRKR